MYALSGIISLLSVPLLLLNVKLVLESAPSQESQYIGLGKIDRLEQVHFAFSYLVAFHFNHKSQYGKSGYNRQFSRIDCKPGHNQRVNHFNGGRSNQALSLGEPVKLTRDIFPQKHNLNMILTLTILHYKTMALLPIMVIWHSVRKSIHNSWKSTNGITYHTEKV